jgi:SAM-dependent methyltransferase
VASRGAGSGVPQAVAYGGEFANLPVELLRFGRERLAVDAGSPVRREHFRYFIEREAGGARQCDERQAFEYAGIELPAQSAPPDGCDQPFFLIEAQCRDGQAGAPRDLPNVQLSHPLDLKSALGGTVSLTCLEGKPLEKRMSVARQVNNEEQATLWNGVAGSAWIEMQPLLDEVLKPFEDLLVQAVAAKAARCVLDVGCGTGATTLAVARRLGVSGQCIGVDISEPMIAVARARAAREGSTAGFISADAQTHPFDPARFNMIISRFGIMFFADSVSAFANLRRAATDDAELCFLAWRGPEENPFMTTAERAAAPLLPNIPPREPDAPGQFAFADSGRVTRILEQGGWAEIDIQPVEAACAFAENELVRYFTQLGPLGRVLHESDEQTRARIVATVRAAFDPYVHGDEVRFNAACWRVCARAVK